MIEAIEQQWNLTRMRIEARIALAQGSIELELAESLLFLYDRGEIDVSMDPFTGELLFRSAEIN
jgi:hypothetical protein